MSQEFSHITLWQKATELLRENVSAGVWMATFTGITPVSFDGETFVLHVATQPVKDRLERNYREMIENSLSLSTGSVVTLECTVVPVAPETNGFVDADDFIPAPQPFTPTTLPSTREETLTSRWAGGDIELNPKHTFDTFVPGTSNRFAHAAALSVAEQPAKAYNPLFIYGDAGLGKTHLLQAIAYYVHEIYPSYTVRYISTETFMNQFVDSIRKSTMQQFKSHYRDVDVLLVDDIQFLEGKDGLQEEFFHTFNTLHSANRQIVLSSDRPPDNISTLEDRLRSRFKMGLITDIKPPDIETRWAIMRKKAETAKVPVPDEVLEFIVTRITNNIRELEGALTRVVAYSNLTKETLNLGMAKDVLGDITGPDEPNAITPQRILDATARQFNYSVDDIIGKSRQRPLVTARQVSMYVFRELTDLSFPEIARIFGGRDHSTVMHACEKIKEQLATRPDIYDSVDNLLREVKGPQ